MKLTRVKKKIILKKEAREEIEETKTAQKDRKKGGNEKEKNRQEKRLNKMSRV